MSVAAGAILAGATPQEVEACEKYALAIGLAFQGKNGYERPALVWSMVSLLWWSHVMLPVF